MILAGFGCANGRPARDLDLYFPNPPDGAAKTHTLSDSIERIPQEQFVEWSKQAVCMSYDDWGYIRKLIEDACVDHPLICGKENKKNIQSIAGRVENGAKRRRR